MLLDCGVRAYKRSCDFVHAETAEDVEHKGDLRFLGQARMTTRKHHPQQVVLYCARRKELFNNRRERPLAPDQTAQLRLKGPSGTLTPESIDRAILRRGHEPGGWILRHAAKLPYFESPAEGVLHDVFCQCQIMRPKDTRQCGDHSPGFVAE